MLSFLEVFWHLCDEKDALKLSVSTALRMSFPGVYFVVCIFFCTFSTIVLASCNIATNLSTCYRPLTNFFVGRPLRVKHASSLN